MVLACDEKRGGLCRKERRAEEEMNAKEEWSVHELISGRRDCHGEDVQD